MKCYLPATYSKIIIDTLVFVQHTFPIPTIKTDHFLIHVASDILTLLTYHPSNIFASLQIGDNVKNELLPLATLLNINQITNKVISNLEHQQNIDAGKILLKNFFNSHSNSTYTICVSL